MRSTNTTDSSNKACLLPNHGIKIPTSSRCINGCQYLSVDFPLQDIKISALALLKMVMHARSGGNLEIMGLLLGKVGEQRNCNRRTSIVIGDTSNVNLFRWMPMSWW